MRLSASTLSAGSTLLIVLPARASLIPVIEPSDLLLAGVWPLSEAVPQSAPMARVQEMIADLVDAALQFPMALPDPMGAGIAVGALAVGIVSLIVSLRAGYTSSKPMVRGPSS